MAALFQILSRFGRRRADHPSIAPQQPFVAIGDIHGHDDLLARLLDQIDQQVPDLPIIFVGDYVDRGPDSAGVLKRMQALTKATAPRVICLQGNHEAMLLDFINMPDHAGPRWLRNGGDATLQSFGVRVPEDPTDPVGLEIARDALLDRAGPGFPDWLQSLNLLWQSGNVVVTHAGADPGKPIDPRRGHGLLWGHPEFLKKPRRDGLWLVHGHFITREPAAAKGRVSIDTGAYETGRLTAAIVEEGAVRFLGT